MSKNAAIVGLGDKFVNSYPLNQIVNQGVKDLIKNALNQAPRLQDFDQYDQKAL